MKNKVLKLITLLVLIPIILSACSTKKIESSSKNSKEYAQVLSSAKEIELHEISAY